MKINYRKLIAFHALWISLFVSCSISLNYVNKSDGVKIDTMQEENLEESLEAELDLSNKDSIFRTKAKEAHRDTLH